MVVRGLIASVTPAIWLWICFGLGTLILVVAFASGRLVDHQRPATPQKVTPTAADGTSTTVRGNPALEGAQLVFRSPYLLSIVGIVGLYEIVSTVLDFQFTSTIAHYLTGPAIGQQFSTVLLITNSVSLLVQLFLTSFVMTRFGLGVALLILPIATLVTSILDKESALASP
jgi:AAA family ATP:ADP antiporter